MKKKLILFAAVLILATISLSLVSARGNTSASDITNTYVPLEGITPAQAAANEQKRVEESKADWQNRERPDTYTPGAKHCVIIIEPLQPGQTTSKTSEPQCFATFAEALAFVTNGAVVVPQDFRPDDLTDEILAATTDTVVGIEYIDANFLGSSLTWGTPNSNGCSDGTVYQSNVPNDWNDKISSARAFQGCNSFLHYANANYSGSTHQCAPNCATMSVMNDQTSSVRLNR